MKLTEDQKLIQTARVAIHQAHRAAAKEQAEEKRTLENISADITLLLDNLRAEGIDPDSEYGKQIFMTVLAQKVSKKLAASEHLRSPAKDDDPFLDADGDW